MEAHEYDEIHDKVSSMTTSELIAYCDKNAINIDNLICQLDNTLIDLVYHHKTGGPI
jgi:hypothetical protein